MIRFKTLEVEGFASISNKLSYNLGNSGVNILQGKNGVGKSTLISAFVWTLYGKVLGKDQVEPWEDVKTKEYQGTKCSLSFKKGKTKYQIIRCQKYEGKVDGATGKNRLILSVDGVVQDSLRNKGDVQKDIQEIIGYNLDILKNSIVLGQNITRILDERGDKQKAILDEAFNTIYIQKARDKAKKDREKLRDELNKLGAKIDVKKEKADGLKNLITELDKSHRNFTENIEEELRSVREKYSKVIERIAKEKHKKKAHKGFAEEKSDLVKRRKKLLKTFNAHSKVESQLFKEEMQLSTLEGHLEDQKKLIKEIAEALKNNDKCPTCGKPLKGSKQDLKEKVSNIKHEMGPTKLQVELTKTQIKELETSKKSLETDKKRFEETDELLANLERSINNLEYSPAILKDKEEQALELLEREKSIKSKKAPSLQARDKYKKELSLLKKKVKKLEKAYNEIHKEVKLLDWLINDPLSNSGLKSYIFNQLLSEVSNRTRYYESFCGISLDFSIDLHSHNKSLVIGVNSNGKTRKYSSLSGGEKQLANITASFAIHDVVSESRAVNLLFMDEIFENLDKSNIQVISDLISVKSENKAIHLITHRNEFSIYNSRIVEIEKNHKGVTKILQ